VVPATGPNAGGTIVNIRGSGFDSNTANLQVFFGLTSPTGFNGLLATILSASATDIQVSSPTATTLGQSLLNQQLDILVRNLATGFETRRHTRELVLGLRRQRDEHPAEPDPHLRRQRPQYVHRQADGDQRLGVGYDDQAGDGELGGGLAPGVMLGHIISLEAAMGQVTLYLDAERAGGGAERRGLVLAPARRGSQPASRGCHGVSPPLCCPARRRRGHDGLDVSDVHDMSRS
jgi:hypothetical protein